MDASTRSDRGAVRMIGHRKLLKEMPICIQLTYQQTHVGDAKSGEMRGGLMGSLASELQPALMLQRALLKKSQTGM